MPEPVKTFDIVAHLENEAAIDALLSDARSADLPGYLDFVL